MLNLNSLDNGLGFDCGVSRVLITIYHRFCMKYFLCKWVVQMVYYLWYKAFIESYYSICVKKTIEQIYQNMCLLICKGSLTVWALYAYFSDSQNAAFEL